MPIVLFWVVVAGLTNVLVPQLEVVGEQQNVGLASPDAPSLQAFERIGEVFDEFDSDSAAMVVLEGDQPLGAEAHTYYDELIKRFNEDTKHVQHVQDFWGDPLTAAGSQSPDGKAAYVQIFLAGNQGEALSLESVDAVRDIIAKTPAPPGIHAYLAGSAAQIADQFEVGNEGTVLVTALTVGVIAVMLLIVYRSFITMIIALVTVLIEMSAARGIVSFLANSGFIGLSTYSTNILTLLVIAAGTDYMIFLLGRYHERRNEDMDREAAFYDMYRGTSHVILGSGLTIAGAVFCLYFTRNPYFQSLGIPAALGVLVSLVASLTLAPAVIVIAGRFGLLEPKRRTAKRGWRRIGTAIVRWPGPILFATMALALVGILAVGLHGVLRHQPVHAGRDPVQCGVHGGGASLLQGAAESRTADGRGRPRYAQSHRHDPVGAGGEGRLPHGRHRAGSVDHAAAGHAVGPHVDSVPDQCAKRVADQQPAVPTGSGERSAEAGRGDQQVDRHAAAAVCVAAAVQRHHARAERGVHADRRGGAGSAGQDRGLRRLLPADSQLFLLGAALFRHPVCVTRCGRCSIRWTGSPS